MLQPYPIISRIWMEQQTHLSKTTTSNVSQSFKMFQPVCYATSRTALPPPTVHTRCVNMSSNVQYVSVTHGHRKSTIRQYTALIVLTICHHNLSQEYFQANQKAIPAIASVN